MLQDDKIIENDDIYPDLKISSDGIYLYIQDKGDYISIHQDFNGIMILYLYEYDDYFAVSNSFLYLVEYLKKNNKPMTLDENYAKTYLATYMCTQTYDETLINEIKAIPRDYIIHIDKNKKKLDLKKVDYKEETVYINTVEGLKLLDEWFYKWVNIIRNLKSKTNNIRFDLSGGFDSRLIIMLAICSNIDLDKIYIYSIDNDEHVHREDFEIASAIAKEFGFKLNNNPYTLHRTPFKDMTNVIKLSMYIKLGFHNQLQYKLYNENDKIYMFTGQGSIRPIFYRTPKEQMEIELKDVKKMDPTLIEPFEKVYSDTYKKYSEKFNLDIDSKDLPRFLYKESRTRNHGKVMCEDYNVNRITLSPYFDKTLRRFKLNDEECEDKCLLIAVIYSRYCPKLLDFNFEGGRKICKKTLEHAKEVNEIYPFKMKDLEFISGPDVVKVENEENSQYSINLMNEYLKGVYKTEKFKKQFLEFYPSETFYNKVLNIINHEPYFAVGRAIPIFSILKVINDINGGYDLDEWLRMFFYDEVTNNLYDFNKYLNGEYEKLENENKELRKFKMDVLNSNSWKITKPIRKLKNRK